MLNVGKIENGIVIDHIPAGKSMDIYRYLGLGELDSCVAIIKNAKSDAMGRKDIIKVDGGEDLIDINLLGFIDTNITFRPPNAAFFYPQLCWQIIRISSSLERLSTAVPFSSER